MRGIGAKSARLRRQGWNAVKLSYGIGLALLGVAEAASAQSGNAERRVNVSLGTRLVYDTNALRAAGTTTGGTPRSGEDFIISPTATVDILLPVSRQSVYLSGSIGYDFYADNSQLDQESISLAGGANLAVGRGCTGNVGVDYTRGQNDLVNFIDGFDPTNVNQTVGYQARINCGEGLGLASGIGYRHIESTNSSGPREQSDYNSDTIDVSIGYSRPTLGTLSLYGSYTDTTYPKRLFGGLTGLEDGVEVFGIGLRAERRIGALLGGGISVGLTKVRPKLPGVPGFTGPSYSVDLTITPGDRLRFNLLLARSVDQSNLLDISYSITDSLRLDAEYALSQSLSLTAGGAYVDRRLRQSPAVISPITASDEQNYRFFAGFRYAVRAPWTLSGEVSYNKRSSDNALFGYDSTRAMISIAYGF
jgi:hypothetical protein